MPDINDVCRSLLGTVNDALGAAVVDLNTGLLLGAAHNIPYFTQSYVDAVAAAAVDMFRGRTVSTIEELLSSQRGTEVKNSIKEVQMTTDGTYHFMCLIPEKPDSLMVLITTRKANLGMGWSAMRRAVQQISPLCP
jgi:predicted regulator of Ras-like GTPase activity (Roadblock/LC7/MglB family)